jgi:predicted ATPase/DNA-binding SARP family transcriptional activator
MTAPSTAEPPLPLQLTSFVGREREIADVRRHLGGTRLLTLTGAGGSGKTRLALEVVRRVAGECADGIAWVELAPLTEPDLLPQQVVAALGIREEGGCSATESLLRFLRDRSLLLVVDNCEHLADACAALTDTLLRGCPAVRVLATSREALGVAGERAYLVPPLSMPEPSLVAPEQLAGVEAIQLFVTRARDVLPSFALTESNAAAVAHLCRRLDGIPLALELAAARVKVLTPQQIGERLDDVFALLGSGSRTALPRHRTLRATIDWSFQLLGAPEQRLLRRLSVFSGGFTLDAAEAVCADDAPGAGEVLDLLARLVDRSMVAVHEQGSAARYRLLETVRQYARERLREAGDEVVLRRHAEYFTRLAEETRVELERAGSGAPVARLGVEQDNLRAALHWSLTRRNDPGLAVLLVSALWRYWFHANLWSEGSGWCEAMLAAVPERAPSAEWTRVLSGAGVLAYLARDTARGRGWLEEADRTSHALGDPGLMAMTSYRLAHLYADLGEAGPALARAEEAVRHGRAGGEPWLLAETLVYALAFVHRVQGRPELAEQALAEAERVARAADAGMALTEAHIGQFLLALPRGDLAKAELHARGAYEAARRMGDLWYVSRALAMAAAAAALGGGNERAARLLGFAATLREAAGTQIFPHEQAFYDEVVGGVRQALGEAGLAAGWGAGAGMRFEEVDALVAGGGGAEGTEPPAHDVAPLSPPPASSAGSDVEGAPSLQVLALGPLEIRLHGQLLSGSAWPHSRPREILLYLLAHGEGRTREQIRLAFWPDLSPAQAKNNFHVVLHRLRRVLGGNEWVVLQDDRYRINPEIAHELDATVFERRIAEELREARSGRGSPDRLRAVLALYRGDFLEGETVGDWHMEIHDHLRRLYVDGLGALADLQMESGDFAGAAETLERLVTREELREDAYRRLMHCLTRTGQRDRALRHYARLQLLLREELQAEPEPETRALAERIRGAGV